MRTVFFILLIHLSIHIWAQESDSAKLKTFTKTDNASQLGRPLGFLNGKFFLSDTLNPNTRFDEVGYVFYEGNEHSDKSSSGGLSLIEQYLGNQRAVYFFTKDHMVQISRDQFKACLGSKEKKILLKIEGEPLTDDISILSRRKLTKESKIYMVENFPLVKLGTGQQDIFLLFLVTSGW